MKKEEKLKSVEIYSTLSRKKERFKEIKSGQVKIYSCGPTTYDFLHVGNARAMIVGDLIARIFSSLGYAVTFVRNFTDLDDKIINKANENNCDPIKHSAKYTEECLKDMKSLGLRDPDHSPKVTETMSEIIAMVKTLVDQGTAYVASNGEVLYHVPNFENYGKLAKIDKDNLMHGKRVSVELHKKHPSDFLLWKPAKEGEPFWDSPFGKGRPGWHIECSAMAKKFLGETIDIHHGGIDLTFPHHENEIAQSEMANGVEFSHYWCHNEFLNFGDEKMSKSLGNVVTIRNFVEKFSGPVLRQIMLNTHYRAKIEWNDKIIEQAIKDVERLHSFVVEVEKEKEKRDGHYLLEEISYSEIKETKEKMVDSLSNDFNVPTALSHFFILIREIRRNYFASGEKLTQSFFQEMNDLFSFIKDSTGALWDNPADIIETLNIARKQLSADLPAETISKEEILTAIDERRNAKKSRDFQTADKIRVTLKSKGIELLDHPDGTTTWKYL